jgi:hypothetical protein
MIQEIDNRILHLVYEKDITEISEEILAMADAYEGHIKGRIGCNFPAQTTHPLFQPTTRYVIIYKKSDRLTKLHELQHARYYLDEGFRQEVQTLWDNIHPRSQKQILELLKRMGYPDHVLLDEFQAYYHTERSLFGKIRMCS